MKILNLVIALVLGVGAGYSVRLLIEDPPVESPNEQQLNQTAEEVVQNTPNNELAFTNLYRGAGDRNKYSEKPTEDIVLLIDSQEELDTVWAKLFLGSLATPQPHLDFKSQSVVIAMLKTKQTDSHLATIQQITSEDSKLQVNLQEKIPGNGCPTLKEQSRPIHIVAVAKTDALKATLTMEQSSSAPCVIDLQT